MILVHSTVIQLVSTIYHLFSQHSQTMIVVVKKTFFGQ